MQVRKYRWSRDYESAEEELVQLFEARQITAGRWSAEGGEVFAPHLHAHDKRLWCAEGSIIMTILADGGIDSTTNTSSHKKRKTISLQPGDALELPAGTVHEAVAGISGVSCYESPLPAANPPLSLS